MYEKLDKLRAEVERWKNRIEEDKGKLKLAEQKLQEAENTQILADVGALHLTPEQLAEFLKLAASGNLMTAGALFANTASAGNADASPDGKTEGNNLDVLGEKLEGNDFDNFDFDESEDTDDEENE